MKMRQSHTSFIRAAHRLGCPTVKLLLKAATSLRIDAGSRYRGPLLRRPSETPCRHSLTIQDTSTSIFLLSAGASILT
jgi:hypothetical protein